MTPLLLLSRREVLGEEGFFCHADPLREDSGEPLP
jgi:hypothetical protein